MKTLSILAAVLILIGAGCKGKSNSNVPVPKASPAGTLPASSQAATGSSPAYLGELLKLGLEVNPNAMVIEYHEMDKLVAKVAKDMKEGREEQVAEYVISAGPWRKAVWDMYVVYEFASGCKPEMAKRSRKVEAAIRKLIADTKCPRHSRVPAAEALIGVDTDLAKQTLLAEYAANEPYRALPGNSGDYGPIREHQIGPVLRKLGVQVPDEVVDLDVFRHVLVQDGGDVAGAPKGFENPNKVLKDKDDENLNAPQENPTWGEDRLDEVGKLVNHKLRQMLDQKQFDKLRTLAQPLKEIRSSYDVSDEYRLLAWQCYVQVIKSPRPPPPPGPGIFGSSPDTMPSTTAPTSQRKISP
jgi:hypothetical protein